MVKIMYANTGELPKDRRLIEENTSSKSKRVETYSSDTQQASKYSLPTKQPPKHLPLIHSLPNKPLSYKPNTTANFLYLPRTAWVANINRFVLPSDHPQKSSKAQQRRDRRKIRRKVCSWWKLCCCCLWSLLLLGIGLAAIIVAVTTNKSTQKPTTSTVNTVSSTLANTTTSGSVTVASVSSTSVSASTTLVTNLTTELNQNLSINGDGETGPCETGDNVTHPTGWNYNGSITQTYYNDSSFDSVNSTSPGTNDRGNCFFFGQLSLTTTMWQTVNLTGAVDPLLIDNQTIKFNLSAWLGGWQYQDDNAQVTLIFYNQTNQVVGNSTTIGPVLAADRNSITSLLFRQANSYVPVGARSFIVIVTLTCICVFYFFPDE